uniref:NADH-ubiquinone oxidoreductase chain 4L n=1 Tax=Protankyra bidentata TaxID=2904677 RepID=A0AAU7E3A4_9ECHN
MFLLGAQFVFYFGLVIVFCGLLGILITRSYVISLFLCLEIIVIGLLFLLMFDSSFSLEGCWSYYCISLLAVNACEASAGLAMVVSLSRSHGSTLISSVNLLVG